MPRCGRLRSGCDEWMRKGFSPTTSTRCASASLQLAAFQARFGALHTAQLLSDDELYALEDLIGDFCDLRESVEMAHATPKHSLAMMGKLRKLAALAETFADDATLARLARALRRGLE